MNLSEEYKTKVLNKKWGNLFLLINIIHFLIPIYIYIYPLLFKNTLGDILVEILDEQLDQGNLEYTAATRDTSDYANPI